MALSHSPVRLRSHGVANFRRPAANFRRFTTTFAPATRRSALAARSAQKRRHDAFLTSRGRRLKRLCPYASFIRYFNAVFAKPFRWTYTGRRLQAYCDHNFRRAGLAPLRRR